MNNSIVSVNGNMGRSTIVTESVLSKLEEIFKLGVTDEIACDYAQISTATFYRHLKSNETFDRKIRAAKQYTVIKAANVVMGAIEKGDVNAAKWWLERKHPEEFAATSKNLHLMNAHSNFQVNIVDYDENHTKPTTELEGTGGNGLHQEALP